MCTGRIDLSFITRAYAKGAETGKLPASIESFVHPRRPIAVRVTRGIERGPVSREIAGLEQLNREFAQNKAANAEEADQELRPHQFRELTKKKIRIDD